MPSPLFKSPSFSGVRHRLLSHTNLLSCGKRVFALTKKRTSGDVPRVSRRSVTTGSSDSRLQQAGTQLSLSCSSPRDPQSSPSLLGSRQTLAFSGFLGSASYDANDTGRPWRLSHNQTQHGGKTHSVSPELGQRLLGEGVEGNEVSQETFPREYFIRPSSRIIEPRDAGVVEESEECLDIGELLLSTPTAVVFNRDSSWQKGRNSGPKQGDASSGSWLFRATVGNAYLKLFHGIDLDATGAIAFLRRSSLQSSPELVRTAPHCVSVYLAVLRGHMPVDVVHCRSSVCSPSPGSLEWRLAGERTEGKAAYSIFRPIVQATLAEQPVTLVEIRHVQGPSVVPRLHAASLGHSVIGDAIYSSEANRRCHPRCDKHLMLHSWILKIAPPFVKEAVYVEAPDTLSSELGMKPRSLADCYLADDSVISPDFSFFGEQQITAEEDAVNTNAKISAHAGLSRRIPADGSVEVVCDSPTVSRDLTSRSSGRKYHRLHSKYSDNNTYWDKLGGAH